MALVSVSTVAKNLKRTLRVIVTDPEYGASKFMAGKYFDTRSSGDAFEDDQEYAGLGLASQVAEGEELPVAAIRAGFSQRYIHNKFGIRMVVTEEAVEDNKYPKAIDEGKRLTRALWKTADIDAALVLVRAWNANFVGGDGVPLFSTAHPLAKGGTFSNTLATPLAPNKASVTVMTTAIRKLPSNDGVTEGFVPKKVLCPMDQWAEWRELTGSARDITPGAFNAVNIVKDLSLEVVPNIYWSNTATNWAMTTDCEEGLIWFWRRRPRSRTWMENSAENIHNSISARWSRGWTNPRGAYGSQH